MSNTVTYALLTPDDAPDLLEADVFDGPPEAACISRFLGDPGAADPRHLIMVARAGQQIVGFASGAVLDHPDKPPSLYIGELGVNDGFRRQGIAMALVARLRAEGRARGCLSSWVATEGDNLAARALYRGTGGRETLGVVIYDWDESLP